MAERANSSPEQGSAFPLRIRAPRDFFGGLALIALALFSLWAGSDLAGMTGFSFGPGTTPRLFAGLLIVVGAVIVISGLVTDGPPLDTYALRGPAYVVCAIVIFAVSIRGFRFSLFGMPLKTPELGLVPATFLAFMVSVMGGRQIRWIESLIAAAAMTAFCIILFRYLLQLPFPLWPQF